MFNSGRKSRKRPRQISYAGLILSATASLCVVGVVVWAAPTRDSKVAGKPSNNEGAATEVLTRQTVRAELFAYLQKRAQVEVILPSFPAPLSKEVDGLDDDETIQIDKLRLWIEQRAEKASKGDAKVRYAMLSQHLLIAQHLLQSPNLVIRKQGFSIANESANFTAAHLREDKWLLARIYETFLLPNVSLAHVENGEDPSRRRVIEASVSAFKAAGERSKQISTLEWLISVGNKPKPKTKGLTVDTNTLDWARGTLASVLVQSPGATQEDQLRALALLKAIQSPDMKGFKHLQTLVEARLNKLE